MNSEQQWWPSPFGADDQLGMLNHIDDAKRRAAAALIRQGRMYDLSQVLDEASPTFPGRYFRQTLVTTAHQMNAAMPLGENQVNWMTEIVSTTMQLGTHLDALSHLQIGDRGYNGWTVAELAGAAGVKRLGAETIPQIMTRGWLQSVTHRYAGTNLMPGFLWSVAPDPPAWDRPAGLVGEHNAEVLAELGYSAAEIQAFEDGGVIGNRYPLPA